MEVVTFMVGLLAGIAGTAIYNNVTINNKNQRQRGGDSSTNYQAGGDIKRSGNRTDD